MPTLSHRVIIILILLLTLSCEKELVNPNVGSTETEKDVKHPRPCPMVLIPAGGSIRIGFLPNGLTGQYLIDGTTVNGNYSYYLTNPNLFLGMPATPTGTEFSGLAVDRINGAWDYDKIILSRTRNSEHALYFANLDVNTKYVINSYLVVTAPFAPSNLGWRLSSIEYDRDVNKMYGIFRNSSDSKIAEINIVTGVATLIKTFSGVLFSGMDFTVDSSSGSVNFMYLFTGNAAGNTVCKIYKLDMVNLTNYSTNTTNIPMYAGNSGFLYHVSGQNEMMYVYTPLALQVYSYDYFTNNSATFVTQKVTSQITNSGSVVTYGTPTSFAGEILTDAAGSPHYFN